MSAADIQLWQLLLALAGVLLTMFALTVGTLKWLLDRHDDASKANSKKLAELERQGAEKMAEIQRDILRLRADLPLEYVRREDWIRFGNTIDAKLDTYRAEMNSGMAALRSEFIERLPRNGGGRADA